MSAFIVSDKTINRIVSFLNADARNNSGCGFKKMGYALDQSEELERLARDLHLMNCDAVDDRYGKGTAAGDVPVAFAFHWENGVSRLAILKHAKCLRYQCSEGNIPERPLYNALELFIESLSDDIISDLPEYENAKWG
jgi:hypothetical protein